MDSIQKLLLATLSRLSLKAHIVFATDAAIRRQPARCLRPASALLMALTLAFASAATAQTAHFVTAEQVVQDTYGEEIFAGSSIGMAVDAAGNIYIVDSPNHVLRMASPSINGYQNTTIAYGLNAEGVAVDQHGNVYIADTGNQRLLKETLSGGVYTQTSIGNGTLIPEAVAVDAAGNVFVIPNDGGSVFKLTPSGSTYTQSTVVTGLNGANSIAVDSNDNLYIAEWNQIESLILKETLSAGGYVQSTIDSNINLPQGIGVDQSGNVYVASTYPAMVTKEVPNGSSYTGTPVPTVSTLYAPAAVAFDSTGNLYIEEDGNVGQGFIYKEMRAAGNFGSVSVGNANREIGVLFQFDTGGVLGSVNSVTEGAYNLDFINGTQSTSTCVASARFSAGDQCAAFVNFDPTVAGSRIGAVNLKDTSGNTFASAYLAGTGVGPQANFLVGGVPGTQKIVPYSSIGESSPYAVAVDAAGSVYIADSNNNRVLKETLSGGVYTESQIGSGLNSPAQVAVDGLGNVYIADTGNSRVVKETLSGGVYTQSEIDNGFSSPNGVAVDAEGNVYVADTLNDRVIKLTLSGNSYYLGILPTSGLSTVFGLAVDLAGNVYIADTGNNRIVEESPSGTTYTQSVVVGSLNEPFSVAVDGFGNVFIAQFNSPTILRESPVAGGGFSRQEPATGSLNAPYGIAVDGLGNVYISDVGNNQVYKEDYADAPSIAFDPTNVGQTSADSPYYLVLENIGNAPMLFPAPATGTNPSISSNFSLDGTVNSACPAVAAGAANPASLAPNSLCTLAVSFSPTTTGSLSGSLVVTDNALNAAAPAYTTQTIALSGTGLGSGPTVSLSATSEPFGSQQVGTASASRYITLTNTSGVALSITSIAVAGTNASSFVFANTCGTTLAPGANCSIHGHFAPATGGALTASITLTDNAANSPQTIALTGTGVEPPVTLSATSLTFPATYVGSTSASQSVTLTNTGTTALSITSIAVTGANASSFVFANSCGSSLAVGANCSIHGHFAPTKGGVLTASVTITDNAATSPQSISLSGTGVVPPVGLSATSLSFGSIDVGATSGSQSVTMTNNGTTTLTITGIVLEGSDASSFVFANNCGTSLAAGTNCTIHGHFAPVATGALTATIKITDSASTSPQSIALSGTGLPVAPVTLSSSSLNFPATTVGSSSSSQSVTLTNNGTATLTFTSIAVTGVDASSFVFANSCATTLAVAASCTIHGHFAPTSKGAQTAAITITDNASGSPQSIALTGTGQ